MTLSLRKLSLPVVLLLALGLTGCGSSSKNTSGEDSSIAGVDNSSDPLSAVEVSGDSDSGKAGPLQTVYFGFDSSSLSSSTKDALNANAEFLKANPSVEVQIEGHADERGSVQYNLALGEKRAKAVQSYLSSLGVESRRLSVISFGKERPVAFGHSESAWSKNRRANFVVTAK